MTRTELEELEAQRQIEIDCVFPPDTRHGVLSDGSIHDAVRLGLIVIRPFEMTHLQPASYDVSISQYILLQPGACRLADSVEWFEIPSMIRGQLAGRSSVGRLFVSVHEQAGYLDPGFKGTITFELRNSSNQWREFMCGDRIGQVSFDWLDRPAQRPYKGRYQGQRGPTESLFMHGDA